jgi:predicted HTH domain antitoxin
MRTLKIDIPENIELNDREAKMLLASILYAKGKLSLGQAAEFAGLSKRAFMEILSDYDVSIINHPITDIENDIKNARHYSS